MTTAVEWNRRHAPGARVRYFPDPNAPAYMETTTARAAWTLSNGRALVRLTGMRQPVPLASVRAVEQPPAAAGTDPAVATVRGHPLLAGCREPRFALQISADGVVVGITWIWDTPQSEVAP